MVDLAGEFRHVVTAAMAQLDPLEIAPDPLVRIDSWRVTGQGFEIETRRRARQEILDGLAPRDRRALPRSPRASRGDGAAGA